MGTNESQDSLMDKDVREETYSSALEIVAVEIRIVQILLVSKLKNIDFIENYLKGY